MLEHWVAMLQQLPVEGILLAALVVTFVENVFPPSPSDTLLLFCGVLVGLGAAPFVPMLLAATVGSVAGFALMFWLGYQFGVRIVQTRRLRWLPLEMVERVQRWFRRYGYWVIVANRFLSGTRGAISFVAGMSELRFVLTLLLSTVSALVWNGLLLTLGWSVGRNWQQVAHALQLYGTIITAVVVALVGGWFLWNWLQSRRNAERKLP